MENAIKTAAEYRAEAKEWADRERESWERSDTDGFLSQWASGLSQRLAIRRAELIENGRIGYFVGLYDGDRRVAAKQIRGQYGWVWLLRDDEAAKYGRKFIPVAPYDGVSRVQKSLGLAEIGETAPAWADIKGSGTGLSGSAWVATFRTGDQWGLDSIACPDADPSESADVTE